MNLILLGNPSSTQFDQLLKQRRGEVEEAQCGVERFGREIDYSLLEGLWLLRYTTAADVVPLMNLDGAPSFQSFQLPGRVGAIYQRFTSLEEGVVQNIIKVGDGVFLQSGDGLTFIVNATFVPSGPRTINLSFKEAVVGQAKITDGFEALLAPAILPRGWLQQRLLLGVKEFNLTIPLLTPSALANGSGRRQAAQGRYLLSYLDEDLLIGRAQVGGGSFIFTRADLASLND